jgi:hypothetical protein
VPSEDALDSTATDSVLGREIRLKLACLKAGYEDGDLEQCSEPVDRLGAVAPSRVIVWKVTE